MHAGARSLIGLEDKDVYPIRGQTIVIDNPKVNEFISTELGTVPSYLPVPSYYPTPIPTDFASPNYLAGTEPLGDATYIIPRPWPNAQGFTTVLGGKYQEGSWDLSFSADDARGILARCTALAPAIADAQTRILRHNVGLRPARKGGPRVEAEWVDTPRATDWLSDEAHVVEGAEIQKKGVVLVVHAYGFA